MSFRPLPGWEHTPPEPVGYTEDLDEVWEADPEVQWVEKSESDWNRLCHDKTGDVTPGPDYRKHCHRRSKLAAQSEMIARRLEDGGVQGYVASDFLLWKVALHSGRVIPIPNFRKSNLIPSVAQSNRSKLLREVEYFIDRRVKGRRGKKVLWKGSERVRMMVVTAGPREECGAFDRLRDSFGWLARQTSILNRADWFRDAGLEIVLRSCELGSLTYPDGHPQAGQVKTNAVGRDGRWRFHPHAHLLVLQRRWIPPAEWSALVSRIRAHFGTHFDESGEVAEPREVCKYVTKPADIVEHLSPADTAELFHALRRLHLVQPMGELREQIKGRRERRETLRRVVDDGGQRWEILADWNRRGGDRPEPSLEEKERQALEAEVDEFHGPDPTNVQLVARVAPGPHFTRVSEPALLVRAVNAEMARTVLDSKWIRVLAEATREAWETGCYVAKLDDAPLFTTETPLSTEDPPPGAVRVHNTPLTGRAARPSSLETITNPP